MRVWELKQTFLFGRKSKYLSYIIVAAFFKTRQRADAVKQPNSAYVIYQGGTLKVLHTKPKFI